MCGKMERELMLLLNTHTHIHILDLAMTQEARKKKQDKRCRIIFEITVKPNFSATSLILESVSFICLSLLSHFMDPNDSNSYHYILIKS